MIKEFVDRCKLAARSMQVYITAAASASTATATAAATAKSPATDAPTATPAAMAGGVPPPELDPDTLTTPTGNNDELGMALTAHRTALAAALRARETTATPDPRLASPPDLTPPQMRVAVGTPEPASPLSPVVRGSPDSRLDSWLGGPRLLTGERVSSARLPARARPTPSCGA